MYISLNSIKKKGRNYISDWIRMRKKKGKTKMIQRRLFFARKGHVRHFTKAVRPPLRFVFLEGGAATGKSSVCKELATRGFTVQFENFVELCAANSRYEASGSVLVGFCSFNFVDLKPCCQIW